MYGCILGRGLTFEEIFPLSKNIGRHLEAMSELVIEDPECV
jgi:hypothetical protein